MARAELIFLNQREEDLVHEQSIQDAREDRCEDPQPIGPAAAGGEGRAGRPRRDDRKAAGRDGRESAGNGAQGVRSVCAKSAARSAEYRPIPTRTRRRAASRSMSPTGAPGSTDPRREKDAGEFAKLGDALESVDFLWTSLTAGDVPKNAHGPHELWVSMQNTSKHVQGVDGPERGRRQCPDRPRRAGRRWPGCLEEAPLDVRDQLPDRTARFRGGSHRGPGGIREGRRSDLLAVYVRWEASARRSPWREW